jgi:hypothetical protein
VVLPSARLTLLQVLIGVVDLGFCALAMYLLMPMRPDIDFVSLAGSSSWRPCSASPAMRPAARVFDAAIWWRCSFKTIAGDAGGVRILYFLIPFGISISIMGTRESGSTSCNPGRNARRLSEACTASAPVPPVGGAPVTAKLSALPVFLPGLPCILLFCLPLTSKRTRHGRNSPTFNAIPALKPAC